MADERQIEDTEGNIEAIHHEDLAEDEGSEDSCELFDDDELIVIETGDGAPLVGTVETAGSYYVIRSPSHSSVHGLSPSGMIST